MKILSCSLVLLMAIGLSSKFDVPSVFADSVNTATVVDSDGTIHGAQIGTDIDGKPIYNEPVLTGAL